MFILWFVCAKRATLTLVSMQGSRLTAYELVHEKIPATLITDSMAAALMKSKKIHAVVVGADRLVQFFAG